MKLSTRDGARFVANPDPSRGAILIYGADPMRIADRREKLATALAGPEAAAEMRLERLDGAALRADPAALQDAMRAQGFFPGQRVVMVTEAGDGLALMVEAALSSWEEGDAFLILTAGQLAPRSALRKLFEGAERAAALPVYADAPDRAEVEATIGAAGLGAIGREGRDELLALGQTLPPGDFAQLLEKLALYTRGQETEIGPEDIAAVAPPALDADIDTAISAVAAGDAGRVGTEMRRLALQGVAPTTLCIGVARHFRQLHGAASDPAGPGAALSRARPPVFGPRRDRMAAEARGWGPARLERALHLLLEADLSLRSTTAAPAAALLERALIRIAMLRPR
ncbi:MAG: DNA polymerase III subunit delta [Pseudomonadota bacterium]